MTRWTRTQILAFAILMAVCSVLKGTLAGPSSRDGSDRQVAGPAATDATVVVKFVPRMPTGAQGSQKYGEDASTAGHDLSTSSALARPDAWRYMGKQIWDPAFSIAGGKYLLCGANPAVGKPGFVVRVDAPLPKRPPAESAQEWPWILVLDDGTVWVVRAGGAESPIRGEKDNISYYQWRNGAVADHEYIIGEPKRGRVWTCHYVKVRYDESKREYVPLTSRWARIRKLWL